MVDSTGAVASYTPVTSQITSISDDGGAYAILATGWGNGPNALSGVANRATSQNGTVGKIAFTPGIPNVTKVVANTRLIKSTNKFYINDNLVLENAPTQELGSTITVYDGPPVTLNSYSQEVFEVGTWNSDDFNGLFIAIAGRELIEIADPAATGSGLNPVNGSILINEKVLTLTDDTDLAYFKPGDVVQVNTPNPDNKVVDVIGTTMTVDGGEWAGSNGSNSIPSDQNRDEVWSDRGTYNTTAFFADRQFEKVFNGYVDVNYWNAMETVGGNDTVTVTINPPLPSVSGTFTLYLASNVSGSKDFEVNGSRATYAVDPTPQPYDFSVSEISSLGFVRVGNQSSLRLFAIATDGKFFVNPKTLETEVTGPAKSGEGTFVSTNGTDEIVVKDSNDQWIDNQNRLGIDFYVKEMNAFLKAGIARDEAEYQAIADALAAYPGKVEARVNRVQAVVAKAAQVLSDDDAALLRKELKT